MVSSVNSSNLAALLVQEQALAARTALQSPADNAVAQAGDNPAVVYGLANGAPSLSAVLALSDSLNRAASISDAGIGAGHAIAGLLSMLRDTAAAAQQAASTPNGLQALEAEFQSGLATIDQIAGSAAFHGVRMLDGNPGQDLTFQADVGGQTTVSLTPQDFTTAGPVLGLAGASLTGDLPALLDRLDTASGALADRLDQMSAQSEQIQAHLGVVGQLQSALAGGDGASADVDSARLQALAVQQALAGQTASLANQAPQALLSLFRS